LCSSQGFCTHSTGLRPTLARWCFKLSAGFAKVGVKRSVLPEKRLRPAASSRSSSRDLGTWVPYHSLQVGAINVGCSTAPPWRWYCCCFCGGGVSCLPSYFRLSDWTLLVCFSTLFPVPSTRGRTVPSDDQCAIINQCRRQLLPDPGWASSSMPDPFAMASVDKGDAVYESGKSSLWLALLAFGEIN